LVQAFGGTTSISMSTRGPCSVNGLLTAMLVTVLIEAPVQPPGLKISYL
jgi:hypothetical protein